MQPVLQINENSYINDSDSNEINSVEKAKKEI